MSGAYPAPRRPSFLQWIVDEIFWFAFTLLVLVMCFFLLPGWLETYVVPILPTTWQPFLGGGHVSGLDLLKHPLPFHNRELRRARAHLTNLAVGEHSVVAWVVLHAVALAIGSFLAGVVRAAVSRSRALRQDTALLGRGPNGL